MDIQSNEIKVPVPPLFSDKETEIDKLIADAQDGASDSRPFMEPKTSKTGKKKGRPRKDPHDPRWAAKPETPPQPAIDPAIQLEAQKKAFIEVLKPTFGVAFGMLEAAFSQRIGKKCQLVMEEEISQLADVWAAVAVKYAPTILGDYAEIIAAVTVSGVIYFAIKNRMTGEIMWRRAEDAKNVQSETQGAA